MWSQFFIATAFIALILYVPGYLCVRALNVSRWASLCCAPLVSVVLASALCIAYEYAGVFCDWAMLICPLVALSVLCFLISLVFRRGRLAGEGLFAVPPSSAAQVLASLPGGGSRIVRGLRQFLGADVAAILGYVLMGLAVGAFVFVRSLDGAASFSQEYDNIHHLALIQTFISSGNWSPLHASLYSAESAAIAPLPGTGFYPAVWHMVAACAVSALGVPVALAQNATNYVFCSMVFPASAAFLMKVIFADRPGVVWAGVPCVMAFSAFPWIYLTFGPLYPNLASFALAPLSIGLFVQLCASGLPRRQRVVALLLFVVSLVALALTQTNACFTVGVVLIPFCIAKLVGLAGTHPLLSKGPAGGKLLIGVCAALLFAGIWYVLFSLPFMQGVVWHVWSAFARKSQALVYVLSLTFAAGVMQIPLALLVAAGAVYTLFRKKYLWITIAYALFCLIYIVDITSEGFLKHLLAGFWYTDSHRIAASAVFCALPLASIGLYYAAGGLKRICAYLAKRTGESRGLVKAAPLVAAALAILIFFYPSFTLPDGTQIKTAFGALGDSLETTYVVDEPKVFDQAEQNFVEQVEEVIPEGSLVINIPDDGSAFAYGADGLEVYYRNLRTYGTSDETAESVLIREGLCNVATDESVQNAVRSVGAEYLLVLDLGGEVTPERPYLWTYDEELWAGLIAIGDDTPGFSLVLSEGDMRLYHIDAVA